MSEDVVANWRSVCSEIARAATDCGRAAADVTLVAVSKTFDGDHIWPVIEAGQRVFGENRVQEAKAKWPDLRARTKTLGAGAIQLHLIGLLQSNKAREAVELFDVIETVDRPKIAEALAGEIARQGRHPRLYVQVNTGAEPQKAGILPEQADDFIASCRGLGLTIDGLMCIPPVEGLASPHFALLAQIAVRNRVPKLSMGMSADYPLAIQNGATHVRVGSAIFGHRDHG
ncbi:YggS family pyridoxal phosphate-dependent enzyme [Methylovirgula sp. 4M-Z18]|uniref:YggS family pyridoxal phosphate-dependent enzyme n=1 Tax=Methylovirgula sp. 4M-Z18 TaxID=2293567 RepID=UPI001FE1DF29|nr:YggS family pyridoxal phosphate-dependent enzyme [Methylovirgula sp. 4M-Z18]